MVSFENLIQICKCSKLSHWCKHLGCGEWTGARAPAGHARLSATITRQLNSRGWARLASAHDSHLFEDSRRHGTARCNNASSGLVRRAVSCRGWRVRSACPSSPATLPPCGNAARRHPASEGLGLEGKGVGETHRPCRGTCDVQELAGGRRRRARFAQHIVAGYRPARPATRRWVSSPLAQRTRLSHSFNPPGCVRSSVGVLQSGGRGFKLAVESRRSTGGRW